MPTYSRRVEIEAPVEEVFAWHKRKGVFQRLTPPWERVEVIKKSGGIEPGGILVLRMRTGPFSMKWVAEHRDYEENRFFRDVQTHGPFSKWIHTHRFQPLEKDRSVLSDEVEYALPFGRVGNLVGGSWARSKIERLFEHRHQVTRWDTETHLKYKGAPGMKVAVTGSTGLIGSSLTRYLESENHKVLRVVRGREPAEDEVQWDPGAGDLDAAPLVGTDAVVHLAGENIASGRWTEEQKQKIRESRVKGTRLAAEKLAGMDSPPQILICASAIGYYGNRGDETLDETSSGGTDFLATVCQEWEEATQPAVAKGVRVVNLRFGVVLSPQGGALANMLLPFKMGLGGVVGDGKQWMSWIALDDAVGAIHHALMNENLQGPVNVVSPNPVTNREFTKTLGRVLGRPTLFPMPSFAARLAFGEMADALLLASQRVTPSRLEGTEYEFRLPHLEGALRHLLGK